MRKGCSQALVLIQKLDMKSTAWASALSSGDGAELVPLEGSPVRAPWYLIKHYFSGDRVDGFIFRYLNDYPSLLRSLVRAGAELLTYALIVFLHRGEVAWICHNVDRETDAHHPRLSAFRRRFLIRVSKRIFVTSDLLVEHARKYLQIPSEKVGVAAFGKPPRKDGEVVADSSLGKILQAVKDMKLAGCNVGLWVGSPAGKSAPGLCSFVRYVLSKKSESNCYCGVIVGVSEQWVHLALGDDLYREMIASEVFKLFGKVEIPWSDWAVFDYIWKPCEDVSLTMTALNAAAAGVPLVAHQGSFIGDFVQYFGIGVSVDPLEPAFSGSLIASDLRKEELWSRQCWRSGALSLVGQFARRPGVGRLG